MSAITNINRFNIPIDIVPRRQQFFTIPNRTFSVTIEQHELLWPFMTNMWIRKRQQQFDDTKIEYFQCRLGAKNDAPSQVDEERRKRLTSTRNARGCNMTIKKITSNESVVIALTNGEQHNHSLLEVDQTKRCEAVRDIIKTEISQGYVPKDVRHNLQQPELAEVVEPIGMQYAGKMMCIVEPYVVLEKA